MNSRSRWLPTNTWVRLAIVPALVFMALVTNHTYLADFWHHLARGRAIVTEGRLIDHDVFTFTVAGREFQDVNWLSQVVYYRLFEQGGLELVRAVNALTLALTLALVVWLCWRKCAALLPATMVGILTFLGLWEVLTVRPQTFSLLLFALLYLTLDGSERRPWLLLLGPPVLALWANLHGAFPAGLLLIGCFFVAASWEAWRAGERLLSAPRARALALCLLAGILATMINPYGLSVYRYVGLTSNTAAQRRIDEWVPPGLDQMIGVAFFLSLALLGGLFAIAWVRARRWPQPRELCLIAVFLPLAAGSVRMVAWWLLVIAPMLATLLTELFVRKEAEPEEPSLGAGLFFGLIVMAAVFCLPGLQPYNPLLVARGTQAPRVEQDLEAVHRHLRANARAGRVFSRLEWGEYLGWAGAPDFKVFMDGRIEIYPDEVWDQYAAVTCGRDSWESVLNAYRVDWLLLDADYHARTGLLPRVERSATWQQVFRSNGAVLFMRRPNTHATARR
jgi:hypothetical protein